MQHNRQYGHEDQEVKKLLEKYRQRPNFQPPQTPFPQYSAVKYNNNEQDNLLGASEVSWLDKMAEINDKVCDQTVYYGREQSNVLKPSNSMKFSFNQNYQTQSKEDEKKNYNNTTKTEEHSSLRDIYMKELEKESEKIKQVQRARKQILESINEKKYATNRHKKQNLVGSIRRKNSVLDNFAKNQTRPQPKVSLGFEAIELPKNIILQKKKQSNKQQEMNSLRYLQESLAKTKRVLDKPEEPSEKIQISKKNYLQLSSHVKYDNPAESSISVREFNEKEVTYTQLLHLIFDKVDKCSIGKLEKTNCDYQKLEDVFKISFGSIFSRIKFKNLTMNKLQFVKIGLQIIRQLNSQEFSSIIERTIREHEKLQRQGKNKAFYCQKCQNKISKVVTFSPEKSSQINREDQHSQGRRETYLKQQSALKNLFTKHQSNIRSKTPTERILQGSDYRSYKAEKTSRQKQSTSNSKFGKTLQDNDYEISTKRQKKQLEKASVVQYKKKRNISESMIAEHKRSLQDLVVLTEKMQNCLTVSRKFTSESQKVLHYPQLNIFPSYQFLQ